MQDLENDGPNGNYHHQYVATTISTTYQSFKNYSGFARAKTVDFGKFGNYVAAKVTYIRLLHGKISFLGFFWT